MAAALRPVAAAAAARVCALVTTSLEAVKKQTPRLVHVFSLGRRLDSTAPIHALNFASYSLQSMSILYRPSSARRTDSLSQTDRSERLAGISLHPSLSPSLHRRLPRSRSPGWLPLLVVVGCDWSPVSLKIVLLTFENIRRFQITLRRGFVDGCIARPAVITVVVWLSLDARENVNYLEAIIAPSTSLGPDGRDLWRRGQMASVE